MSDSKYTGKGLIIQGGIIVLILISIGVSGYMINQALNIQIESNKIIDELNKKQDNFVNKWENRIKISNTINNGTRDTIRNEVHQLLTNLSAHRHVTNQTFDEVKQIQNNTERLIKQLNETNEVEREKAVDKLSEEHQVIMNALNISRTDNQTEAASKIDLLLDFLNKTQ